MRPVVRWLVVAIAAVGALPAAASAGAPPWSDPVDLVADTSWGRAALDGDGSVTVVWTTREPRAAFVATRPTASDTFRPAVKLGAGIQPQLAVAESGEALVTWLEPDPGCTSFFPGLCRASAFVRARSAGHSRFGAPEKLAEGMIDVPSLAMNESGEAVVAWPTAEGAVTAVLRSADGHFGRTMVLTRGNGGGFPRQPAVAIGENGAAVVAWENTSAASGPLLAAYRPGGERFGAPEDASEGFTGFSAVAAVSARGTATLAFGTSQKFLVADRSPSGRFEIDHDLGAGGGVGAGFSQDLRGNQLVYWVEQTGFSLPPTFQAHATFRDIGGGWTKPIPILPPNSFPTLELDRLGNAHALWWTDPYQGQLVMGGTITRFGIEENTQQLTTISGTVEDIDVNRAGAVAALIMEFRDPTSQTGGSALRLVTRVADRSPTDATVSATLTRSRVNVTARCDEACRVRAALADTSKPGASRSRGSAVTLPAGMRGTLRVKLTPRARARLRRGARIRLVVRAVDAAGNARTFTRRLAR